MKSRKLGIHLKRITAVVPDEISGDLASSLLLQKMHDHGLRVYVRIPAGTCVVENGIRKVSTSFAEAALLNASPMTLRITREIAKAKRQGLVINHGVENPAINFLELDKSHVMEIVAAEQARVHWFTGIALHPIKNDPGADVSCLSATRRRLRCLRPVADADEQLRRRLWGGALKYASEYCHSFRIQDIHVDERDLDLLRFVLEKPKRRDDPFGIRDSSPAVYFAYRASKKYYLSLLNKTETMDVVIGWLKQMLPKSPYDTKYVAEQLFKFLDPYYPWGLGKGRLPFDREAVAKFREDFPDEKEIGDGLALIISSSMTWMQEIERRKSGERIGLFGTSNLDDLLGRLKFSGHDERLAVCKVIQWKPDDSVPKAKAKAKTLKKPEPVSTYRMKNKSSV